MPLLMQKTVSFRPGKTDAFLGMHNLGLVPLPKGYTTAPLFQNTLQVPRNFLPKTVSHSLAEPAWEYSLGLLSQGIPCLARNTYCQCACLGQRDGEREEELGYLAEKSTCVHEAPGDAGWNQSGTGMYDGPLLLHSGCGTPESKNSKFKPVLLFVKEEG